MADKSRILLQEIECNYCHSPFYLCRKHYHGHRYCSDECRKAFRGESHRESQSKYRTSGNGRKKNSEGAKRRRKKGGDKKNKKNVADQGSTPPTPCIILYPTRPGDRPRCLICGVYGEVVKKFPPRGYGCGKRKRDTENTSGEGRADTTERTRDSEETLVFESGSCCGYCGKPLYEKKIELPFGRKRELSIILPVNEGVAQPDGSIQEGVPRPGKPTQEEAPQPLKMGLPILPGAMKVKNDGSCRKDEP